MPEYTLINTITNERKEVYWSFDRLTNYLEENPDWNKAITAPKIVSGTGDVLSKTDDSWKDVLKTIKKGAGKGNTINV
jgi:hypothetical protein